MKYSFSFIFIGYFLALTTRIWVDGELIEDKPNTAVQVPGQPCEKDRVPQLPKECGKTEQHNVTGTDPLAHARAGHGEVPSYALYEFGKRTCGAVIIGKQTVLVAAHCVHGLSVDNGMGSLRAGSISEADAKYEQHRDVRKICRHPAYTGHKYINDVAVLKVKKSFDFEEKHVQPACISFKHSFSSNDSAVTVAFGGKDKDNMDSYELYKSSLASKCEIPSLNTNTRCFKVADAKPMNSMCLTNTGGPIYHKDDENRHFVSHLISAYLMVPDGSVCSHHSNNAYYATELSSVPGLDKLIENCRM